MRRGTECRTAHLEGHGLDNQCSLTVVCLQTSVAGVNIARLCEGAANQMYMLAHCQGCIHVVLATSCRPADVLGAFVHARVLSIMTTQDRGSDQVIWLTTACTCATSRHEHNAHDCFVMHRCLK